METQSFLKRYQARVQTTNSVLCAGLDLTIDHVPQQFRAGNLERSVLGWGRNVITVAADLVPAAKFQYSYYAKLGDEGKDVLRTLIKFAQDKGLLTVLDFKRIDIGPSMEGYCDEAMLYDADACTLGGPWFGPTFWPAFKPYAKSGRMLVQMVRSSNTNEPENDMQMQKHESGLHMYEWVAQRVAAWHEMVSGDTDELGALGAVVGATHPDEAVSCRGHVGDDVFVLVPGYGAQGGGADGAVAGLLDSSGNIMGTVNSSRAITLTSWYDKQKRRSREGEPLELVRSAIVAATDDLNEAIERKRR